MFDDLLKTIFNVNESENESLNVNENENESVSFTPVKIAHTLINTTKKEDSQMIINHIEIKKYKIFEQDKHSQYVIQPAHKRDDLLDTIKAIQQVNKTIQPYLT